VEKAAARDMLGLPHDARIVLCSSSTPNIRKGITHFDEVISRIKFTDGLFVLSVGPMRPVLPDGLPGRHIGAVNDEQLLARIYSAADVFIMTSIADNLPNTVLESMSCGTPVAGYACGGVPDMIQTSETGLLAKTGDTSGLAQAVERLLSDRLLRERCSRLCRERILRDHTLEVQARRYLGIYSGAEAASPESGAMPVADPIAEAAEAGHRVGP
jgi:glycosyltransferase involved in cell wall biosynthesis